MGTEDYYDDFVDTPEDYGVVGRDSYFDEVQQKIRELYEGDKQSVILLPVKKYYHTLHHSLTGSSIEVVRN